MGGGGLMNGEWAVVRLPSAGPDGTVGGKDGGGDGEARRKDDREMNTNLGECVDR